MPPAPVRLNHSSRALSASSFEQETHRLGPGRALHTTYGELAGLRDRGNFSRRCGSDVAVAAVEGLSGRGGKPVRWLQRDRP